MRICEGRVVVVTGAGRGIGRGEALEFAKEGARVVVNDLGAESDGSGTSVGPAQEVVSEIQAMGGEAVVNGDDGLDVLVNNAGILRDRMLYNTTAEEWDDVVKVHLRGHFLPMKFAAVYWRDRSKRGEDNDARIINTSSASGLFCNPGQANYGAAKAGIAALTVIASKELGRFGVTVNALSPHADTRLTLNIHGRPPKDPVEGFDPRDPNNVAPLVAWLGSPEARDVTGRVFDVGGGKISVLEPWRFGPTVEKDGKWDPAELGKVIPDLVAQAASGPEMGRAARAAS